MKKKKCTCKGKKSNFHCFSWKQKNDRHTCKTCCFCGLEIPPPIGYVDRDRNVFVLNKDKSSTREFKNTQYKD